MTQDNLAARYVQLELDIQYDNDDYDVWCSLYYDRQEHKVEKNCFGHGSNDKLLECSVSLTEALKSNMVTEAEVLDAIFTRLVPNGGDSIANEPDLTNGVYKIPCEVLGGRKWKGQGFLLKEEQRKWDKICFVADPVERQIHEISCKWVHLRNFGLPTVREVFDYIAENNGIAYCAHLIAYQISFYSGDYKRCNYIFSQATKALYKERFGSTDNEFCDYTNVDEQKRLNKRSEFLNKKREEIREWAKTKSTNPEKIDFIVERTIAKYYSYQPKTT